MRDCRLRGHVAGLTGKLRFTALALPRPPDHGDVSPIPGHGKAAAHVEPHERETPTPSGGRAAPSVPLVAAGAMDGDGRHRERDGARPSTAR